MNELKYSAEQMNQVMNLLNNLEVKGIDNAKRIAVISEILSNPKGDEDGSN